MLTGGIRLWMVYALAAIFGLMSGIFMPAAEATLPRLLESDQLEGGNALMMGADQLAQFVGPALAGTVIALFGTASGGGQAGSLTGVGVAFAVDALSFAASAGTLLLMAAVPALAAGAGDSPLRAIAEGLRYTMSQPVLRWMLALLAAANFLVIGPLMVGVPVLAQTRFTQGATAFGLLISAYGLGNLGGMIAAGSTGRPSSRLFCRLVLALFAGFGLVIGSLAFITSVWIGVILLAVLGLGNGYIAVVLMTLLQRIAPAHLLGRLMSLVILAMLGVTPISTALAGAVIGLGAPALFLGCGVGMLVVTAIAAAYRHSWSPVSNKPGRRPRPLDHPSGTSARTGEARGTAAPSRPPTDRDAGRARLGPVRDRLAACLSSARRGVSASRHTSSADAGRPRVA